MNLNVLNSFKMWVTNSEAKVNDTDDDFKAWEQGIKAMSTSGKNNQGQPLSLDTITGIHYTKSITLVITSLVKALAT